jgi:hypothetical protein
VITLATLANATPQQVFDQVANHLLTQGRKAAGSTPSCSYRYSGLKCAGGCLISDEEYTIDMEGFNWSTLVKRYGIPSNHQQLITELQTIHDGLAVAIWPQELMFLAKRNHLSSKVVTNFLEEKANDHFSKH